MGTQIAELYAKIGADTTGLKRGLLDTKNGLQQANSQVGSMASSLKGLATGFAALGIARVAKELYEFGKAGAELDYTRQKFDRLAESIGVTSDTMMKDLRAATKGTMSDMQLAASAGDLMALGLAKSYDEVLRLTKVAGGLGMNMNQLVLTLTNQTTMRFDQLGVKVAGFQEKVDALKASGMSASDAFQEAFLRQAEEQLGNIGKRADTAAGAAARLEASWANFADTARTNVVPAFSATVTALQAVLDAMAQASSMQAETDAMTWTGYGKQAGAILKREARAIIEARKDADMAFSYSSGKAAAPTSGPMAKRYSMAGAMAQQLGKLSFAEARNAFMVEYTERKMEDLNTFMAGPVGKENRTYLQTQRDIEKQLRDTAAQIDELKKTPWKKEEMEQAQQQYADLQKQTEANAEAHKQASKQIIFDLAKQQMAQDGISNSEADALVLLGQKFGLIDEETAQLWESMSKPVDAMSQGKMTAEEWVKVMQTLADRWDVTVAWHYENAPAGVAGSGTKQVKKAANKQQKAEAFANGGTYRAGVPRLVGERGPELDIPSSSGRVFSNDDLRAMLGGGGRGGGITQNINVHLALPRDNYTARQFMRELQTLGGAG